VSGGNDPPRKWAKNSNANESKHLISISPSLAGNAVCAANFAPFLHFFENHFNFNFFATPWLSCWGTLSIAVPAVD
jgi:hypothetical protein